MSEITPQEMQQKIEELSQKLSDSQKEQTRLYEELCTLQKARRSWNRRKVKRALAQQKRAA